MSYLTKYGSFWGLLPQTSGRIFFVAPSASYTVEGRTYSASNDNDGLSPERAVLTVAQAITNCTANVGDVILLLTGAHSVSSTITINKAGITITGVPGSRHISRPRANAGGMRNRTTITSTKSVTSTTDGAIFQVAALDVEIAFLHLTPPAAGGVGIDISPTVDTANRLYVHDCTFALTNTASTTTYGLSIVAGLSASKVADITVSHCYFQSGVSAASGANGAAINVLATTHGMTIENSTFELKGTAAWAKAINMTADAAAVLGVVVRDCDFVNPTTTTTVITTAILSATVTNPGAIIAYRNYVDAGTDFATAAAINVISVAENYLASVATNGGVLATNL